MTDTEMQRIKAICNVAGVDDIGELSDGFHTFNSLYEQRLILFAALVKAYKDKAWKSLRHEDGEYCFGGGWFIVGIDTPEGSYTYHYENKYWDMFDCPDLPMGKHWDGHTEADAETRLMSLEPEPQWIPCSERLPEEDGEYLVLYHTRSAYKPYVYDVISFANDLYKIDEYDFYDEKGQKGWFYYDREYGYCEDDSVIAWMPLPEPYRGEGDNK